ncbi:helix-turn-helix domain-containing protein [Ructibacterium gallinarum]|uniref:Helix-turn-helix transcriptional regulator n=1 Tax=Ructibacterium gallinarum TaxID=2779355 RepID=A0A9D5M354_9FIRM|nr:AraC family transcriptional regulator [Ructibacterium gallinarum]MBE5041256.1 helix-turn-helix transcriptional regulator [Ructibacterium gallinarum]
MLILLRDYDYVNSKNNSSANNQTLSQLALAMQYIENHLEESLTLAEIAQQSTMSKSYFSTMFKKYNGISPWDYITIKRVEKAIGLLTTSNLSKLEIAARCGFHSSANFYKAFARVTGKTPSDYTSKHL